MTTRRTKKRTATSSPSKQYSVFEYLYRDAGNYKAFGQVMLTGVHTEEDIQAIRDACESGEYFIAEQIHIPALYGELYEYGGGPTVDDHVFHEALLLRDVLAEDPPTAPWGSVAELVASFRDTDGKWDYTLSPHWEIW